MAVILTFRNVRILALATALLLVKGCHGNSPTLDSEFVRMAKENGLEASQAETALEIRRCLKYYPGKLPDGEFVRDGNGPILRLESADDSVVYTYAYYQRRSAVFTKTIFFLPVDDAGRIRECRVWTETYSSIRP